MTYLKQLRNVFTVYRTTKKLEDSQNFRLYDIKVNWIGEPYFILDVPSEFWESDLTLNSYVFKQIKDREVAFRTNNIDLLLYPVVYVDRKEKKVLIEMVTKKTFLIIFKYIKWGVIVSGLIYFTYLLLNKFVLN